MFKKVESHPNFAKREEKILEFWEDKRIFEKQEKKNGSKTFVFYEGPPTANGKPHVGHVLARAFKDLFPRYKNMKGFKTFRKGGWDTHGLPVELEVEKELGISGKKEIEDYGVERFNKKCRESVFKYVDDWENLTKRIGFFIDMKNPYKTLDKNYIESCWWILKEFWDKNLLIRDYKVLPYCARCGTSLSSHELSLGYAETEDPSIYVKFKIKGKDAEYLLAWTTTPWTLAGNVALAVDRNESYVYADIEDSTLVVAKSLAGKVLKGESYKVLKEVLGEDLLGIEYEPLYDFIKYDRKAHFVVPASFVNLEEGTGIVHTAVMYGIEDFELGTKMDLPKKHAVDLEGKYVPEVKPWAGKFVKDADPEIINDLKERGLIFKEDSILHQYPFCWRCKSPLLYYALKSYFIKTTSKKKEIIKSSNNTNWYPSHLKEGRMGDWLNNMVDWALSRSRYWGTPLPIWRCGGCGEESCIGSYKELKERAVEKINVDENFDPHKPYIDKIHLKCNKCDKEMTRVEYVIDVWFDSGAMPYAQWHYPFENKNIFEDQYPADFICEGMDQTRGWFYTLLAESTLLFDKNAYKNVLTTGLVLDEKGKKMSKSIGNVVNPWDMLNKFGADPIRWLFYSGATLGSNYRFGPKMIEEVVKRFFLILWNSYKFFVTYANLDNFKAKALSRGYSLPVKNVLDKWILSRLNRLIKEVTDNLDNYDAYNAANKIEEFVVKDFSTWYIRRSRNRVGPSSKDSSDKKDCHNISYYCIVTLSKLMAPFTPFISEDIYRNLVEKESVHLEEWPLFEKSFIDEGLEQEMVVIRDIAEKGNAERKRLGIPVRQPLRSISISGCKGINCDQLVNLIKDELNVKDVVFTDTKEDVISVKYDEKLTKELIMEGKARMMIRNIQNLRRKLNCKLDERVSLVYEDTEENREIVEKFSDYIKTSTLVKSLKPGKRLEISKE